MTSIIHLLVFLIFMFPNYSVAMTNDENNQMLSGVVKPILNLPPIIESGFPEPGKRTIVYLEKYPEAPYVLFLPYNFCEERKWPVIVELLCSSNNPKCAVLGYGLTRGMNCIWITVPYINNEGKVSGWYFPESTVNYWLAVLDDLNAKFSIDNKKIVIAGFSLGAMATSGIGNWNDTISSKWAGYFAHAHFDKCCYRQAGDYKERLGRFKNKKVLITVGGRDPAKRCSLKCYKRLLEKKVTVDFMEIPDVTHSPKWILEDSEYAEYARRWLNSIIFN